MTTPTDPSPGPRRTALLAAAREFNAGRYFEAHEVIEDGLESVPDELWSAHLGLIQVAVGYHKASQGLVRGAIKMLGLGLAKLDGYESLAVGVDLDALRSRVTRDLSRLAGGEFRPAELAADRPRLRPLRA